jgi:hypothetical protein
MAWESRGGSGRYFTTTRRTSGRRVRTYYGNGVAGDLASSMHELRRLERQEQERRHREDCLRWKALEGDLGRLDQGTATTRASGGAGAMTPKATATSGPEPGDGELLELLSRAEQGDREVLPGLRVVLDRTSGVWRPYADLAAQLEGALIRQAAGENLLLQESLLRALQEKKRELGGEETSPLERLLIERVALGWLETHYLDLLEAQGGGLSSRQRAELLRRQDRATSRHMQALTHNPVYESCPTASSSEQRGRWGPYRQASPPPARRVDALISKSLRAVVRGTTLTLAFASGARLFVLRAGDSRCYLYRTGRPGQMTEDHTLVAGLVNPGAIRPEQARGHQWRNLVTNVLGAHRGELRVDVSRARLEPGDVVLLCTDGLTEMLEDARIAAILASETDPEAACRRLVEEANEAGGKDNVTAVVARFGQS